MSEINSNEVETKSTKMKTNFIWTESHSRELSRIERYLRYGTEMNKIDFSRNSSFNAFIKANNESKRCPKKKTLKSVINLWDSVKDFELNAQKSVVFKMETLISSMTQPFHEYSIVFVIKSLFECQKTQEIRSPFRSLAFSLILKPFVKPIDVLVLCHIIGKSGINSSKQIRALIASYYLRDFNDSQTEEFLVFGSKFKWSHSDAIRLCHLKPNPLTKLIMKRKKDKNVNQLNEVEKRVSILRSNKSKTHEVIKALETTTLEPKFWLRALNSVWRRQPAVWLKIIDHLSDDKVLSLIPQILSKFPNHKLLYEEIYKNKLKSFDAKFTSNFIKHYVLYYCEKNVLEIKNDLMEQLSNAIKAIDIPKRISSPILVVFAADLDYERKYLSTLTNKKRKKADLLDQMLVKDYYELLIKSFNCFVSQNESIVTIKSISLAKESDNLEFPFTSLADQWKKRVIYVTKSQVEVELWSGNEKEKLIVLHLNKIELKNLCFYRKNVLVINGFDMKLESVIAEFFNENEEKMDTN